jgi:hypothetical protein
MLSLLDNVQFVVECGSPKNTRGSRLTMLDCEPRSIGLQTLMLIDSAPNSARIGTMRRSVT